MNVCTRNWLINTQTSCSLPPQGEHFLFASPREPRKFFSGNKNVYSGTFLEVREFWGGSGTFSETHRLFSGTQELQILQTRDPGTQTLLEELF